MDGLFTLPGGCLSLLAVLAFCVVVEVAVLFWTGYRAPHMEEGRYGLFYVVEEEDNEPARAIRRRRRREELARKRGAA